MGEEVLVTSRIVVLGAVILPLFASPARGQSRLHPRWVIPGFDFRRDGGWRVKARGVAAERARLMRSEEHTSELQSLAYLVCRLLLEKKKKTKYQALSTGGITCSR